MYKETHVYRVIHHKPKLSKKAENQKSIDGGISIADKIEANIKKLLSKE